MRRPVHGYLSGPSPVFGTYHPPSAPVRRVAYVICPPLGWESIQCYHGLRCLGESLASAGFHTLRLAYHGTGESPGVDEDPGRLRAWLDSIHRSVDALEAVPGVSGVGLVGIRMGATLAVQVSSERPIASLALWEICPSGAHYAREMEILASAAPGAKANGGTPGSDGRDGIAAGGYVLTQETLTDLARLDLWKIEPKGSPSVLVLGRDDRPAPTRIAERISARGCAIRVEQAPGFKEMMIYPEASVPATEGFQRIRAWALDHCTALAAANAQVAPRLTERLELGHMRRRVVNFGSERRLFGVLSEPAAGTDHPRPPVLFLTGGVVPRTSVNRMYVGLADRLASRGHRALRFDISGIGESAPTYGAGWGHPYPPTLLEEVRAALEVLREGHAAAPVWMVGLCSGAYAAFRTALEDEAVRGVVLLNPAAYRPAKDANGAPQAHVTSDASRYRRAVFDMKQWRRLLSGRAALRQSARNALARARMRRAARANRAAERASGFGGVADDFLRLHNRKTEVHLIFAADDPGVEALRAELDGDLNRIGRTGVNICMVEGADHTFNASRIRADLMDRIVQTVSPA